MCQACNFTCCKADMLNGCGCVDACDCEQCWPEDGDSLMYLDPEEIEEGDGEFEDCRPTSKTKVPA